MTLADQVFDYVRRNPGTTYRELSADLGLSPSHARACLARLLSQGLLAVRRNGKDARRFFPADERAITDHVIERARQFGGPFGVLAAQVMQ